MPKYDVVIIGAGPAGLNCAQTLAKSKKKVLLLEKNKIIGPKVCAGGITNRDLKYLKLPKKLIDNSFKELIMHSALDKTSIKQNKLFVYTIDRKNLGQWQLKKLKRTKTEIRTNAKVTKIAKNYIIINKKEKIKFKYLVGADGSSSIVRLYLGLKAKRRVIALQYIVPTKKYKKMEMFLDVSKFGGFKCGYAWIFPHKNYVSIGCGLSAKNSNYKELPKHFKKWLKERKIDISKGEYQAYPINIDYQGHKFKNIFLIGDAAGLASELTGEGIYQALISGEEIAKMILNKKYNPTKLKKIIKQKELHHKIQKIFVAPKIIQEIEVELLVLIAKNRFMDKKIIDLILD